MEENDLTLIEKYVCATYDPHNCFHTKEVNRVRFPLLQSQVTTNWESFPWQERLCGFIILRSAYAAGWTWDVTLQPSVQIPSLVDWEWKYSKDNMFAADWCRAYDVNLNEYIFTCTCKELCFWCKWKKYHVFHFAVASVLQHKKILLDSLFIHMQTRIYNPVKYLQWTLFLRE